MPTEISTASPALAQSTRRRFWFAESCFIWLKSHAYWLQMAMLMVFLWLIIAPLSAPQPSASDSILSSRVLLSQFLFWGLWYGACLFSVIIFGRLWCGALCPLGAVSQWVSKWGMAKALPRWVRWDGWLVVMFISITILGQTMDVRDDVWGMLKLFAMIFFLAMLLGLLYGKNNGRPWCRYFCPIGKILGVVARLGMIDFRPNKGVKALPEEKSYYVQGRLCPTDYNLPYKVSNNNCIACGRCTFKQANKQAKAGMGVYLRKPGAEVESILRSNPSWTEVIFILLSPGLSAGGFLWLILHQYQLWRDWVGGWALNLQWMWMFDSANWLISSQAWNQHFNWLDVICITTYMLAYGFGVAAVCAIFIAVAAKLLSSRRYRFKEAFLYLTYQFTPIAILSIVIGLCGKFFQTMEHDFALPQLASIAIKASLFLASIAWTIYLLRKTVLRLQCRPVWQRYLAYFSLLAVIVLLVLLWYPAIFNYTYMSDVEKIRKHIVLP